MLFKNRKFVFTLLGLYLLANLPLIFNQGIFWDDWSLYKQLDEITIEQFKNAGYIQIGWLHVFLKNIWTSPLLYHWLTIVTELASFYFLFRICLENKNLNHKVYFTTVLIIAVMPYYASKTAMIDCMYTLCLFLFILASFLLQKSINTSSFSTRLLSLILFFVSFSTNSLLFFYLIPVQLILFKGISIQSIGFRKEVIQKGLKNVLNYSDFILLPIVFFIIKMVYFKPSALFEESNYNAINFSGLLKAIPLIVAAFQNSFVGLFREMFESLSNGYLFIGLFSVLIYPIFKLIRALADESVQDKIPSRYLPLIGLILFLVGAFPYVLVGHLPSFEAYDTRHQLLLSFGSALMLLGVVINVIRIKFQNLVVSMLLSAFVTLTFNQQLNFLKHSYKQKALEYEFAKNDLIKNHTSFILKDFTKEYNATSHQTPFYEYNGISRKVFGDEKRLIIERENFENIERRYGMKNIINEASYFNMNEYEYKEFEFIINIKKGKVAFGNFTALKWMIFGIDDIQLDGLLELEVVPLKEISITHLN